MTTRKAKHIHGWEPQFNNVDLTITFRCRACGDYTIKFIRRPSLTKQYEGAPCR